MDDSLRSREELRVLDGKRLREGLSGPEQARWEALTRAVGPTPMPAGPLDPIVYAQELVAKGHDPVLAFLQAGESLEQIAARGYDTSGYLPAGPGAAAWPSHRVFGAAGPRDCEALAPAPSEPTRADEAGALALWEADRTAMFQERQRAQDRHDRLRAEIRERARRAEQEPAAVPAPPVQAPRAVAGPQVQDIVARLRPPTASGPALTGRPRPPSAGMPRPLSTGIAGTVGPMPPREPSQPDVKPPAPQLSADPVAPRRPGPTGEPVAAPSGPGTSEILVGTELLTEESVSIPGGVVSFPLAEPQPTAPAPTSEAAATAEGTADDQLVPSLQLTGERPVLIYLTDGSVSRGLLRDQDLNAAALLLESRAGVASIARERATLIFFLGIPGTIGAPAVSPRVRIALTDGWNLLGFIRPRAPQAAGFFVVPSGPAGATEQVFVFQSAVRRVTPLP